MNRDGHDSAGFSFKTAMKTRAEAPQPVDTVPGGETGGTCVTCAINCTMISDIRDRVAGVARIAEIHDEFVV